MPSIDSIHTTTYEPDACLLIARINGMMAKDFLVRFACVIAYFSKVDKNQSNDEISILK